MRKDFVYVVLAQAIQVLGNLVLVKLLARWFSIDDFGLYALAISLFTLGSVLPFTPLGQGILRYVSIFEKKQARGTFLKNVIIVHLGVGAIYLAIATLGSLFLTGPWKSLFPVLCIHLVIDAVKNIFTQFELGAIKRSRFFYLTLCEFGSKIICVSTLHNLGLFSVQNLFLSFWLASFICICLGCWFRRSDLWNSSQTGVGFREVFTGLWGFSSPLLWTGTFEWIRTMSQRWILEVQLNTEAVGIYAIMSSLALFPANALYNVLGAFVQPSIYEAETHEKGAARRKLKALLPKLALLQIFGLFVVYPLREIIVSLLTDHKYLPYTWMLTPMLASSFFSVFAMVSTFDIFATGKTKRLLIPMSAPGAVSLFLGYFLIQHWGLKGAVATFISTNVLMGLSIFVVTLGDGQWIARKELP